MSLRITQASVVFTVALPLRPRPNFFAAAARVALRAVLVAGVAPAGDPLTYTNRIKISLCMQNTRSLEPGKNQVFQCVFFFKTQLLSQAFSTCIFLFYYSIVYFCLPTPSPWRREIFQSFDFLSYHLCLYLYSIRQKYVFYQNIYLYSHLSLIATNSMTD